MTGLEPTEKKIPTNREQSISFSEKAALLPQGRLEDSQPESLGNTFYEALQGDPRGDGLTIDRRGFKTK